MFRPSLLLSFLTAFVVTDSPRIPESSLHPGNSGQVSQTAGTVAESEEKKAAVAEARRAVGRELAKL